VREAVEEGKPFLVVGVGETIDPPMVPIVFRVGKKQGKQQILCLGDDEIEVHKNYRLYLHTKLPNPHYPPEVHAETTVINFCVEFDGLEEQLLEQTVRLERAELASETQALVMQANLFTIRVKELEDNILERLTMSAGDVAEDGDLIEELEFCKKTVDDIGLKLRENRATANKLDEIAEKYRPVAKRGAVLFFVMDRRVPPPRPAPPLPTSFSTSLSPCRVVNPSLTTTLPNRPHSYAPTAACKRSTRTTCTRWSPSWPSTPWASRPPRRCTRPWSRRRPSASAGASRGTCRPRGRTS